MVRILVLLFSALSYFGGGKVLIINRKEIKHGEGSTAKCRTPFAMWVKLLEQANYTIDNCCA